MAEGPFVLTEVRRYGPDADRTYSEAIEDAKETLALRAETSHLTAVTVYEVYNVPDGDGGEVAVRRVYR